ncbi:MAG: hypothetical protein ACXWJB_10460 [Limisphaerales bacterium]
MNTETINAKPITTTTPSETDRVVHIQYSASNQGKPRSQKTFTQLATTTGGGCNWVDAHQLFSHYLWAT